MSDTATKNVPAGKELPSTAAALQPAIEAAAKASGPINIQPGHGKAGRHATRGFLDSMSKSADVLSGNKDPGLFGRMFPSLPPLQASDTALQALATAMKDPNPGDSAGNNPDVPAGFTYLGQFIDHDITLDLTSIAEKEEDPLATTNFRTPRLDLDSVYGLGPDGSPQLYARNPLNGNQPGPKLLIGRNLEGPDPAGPFRNDLPRSPEGFALIGDHRNDENLLVAQTHLAFLKFHNKVVDVLSIGPNPPADIFAAARKLVVWHYQWMVLHDFVERLTEPGMVAKILHDGRKFYRFKTTPYMPVEFSAAAYRMGHSMVRERYSHNRIFNPTGFDLPLSFHRAVRRYPRRSRPRGRAQQLDHRLAPVLRLQDARGSGVLPEIHLASSTRSSCRRFTRFRGAAAACRSATCGAGSTWACPRVKMWRRR